jgi:hypothetical protein
MTCSVHVISEGQFMFGHQRSFYTLIKKKGKAISVTGHGGP